MTKFNPDSQKLICHDAKKCYSGNYPTLGELRRSYGDNTPQAWLVPQLLNLSEFCGVKEKITNSQIAELSYIIATEYYYLKVTELMYFFHLFKAGHFGKFYGNIDPLVITNALRDFLHIRCRDLDAIENERRKAEMEARKRSSDPPITYAEYLKIKEQGNGL